MASPSSGGTLARLSLPAPAIACGALLLGAFMGYASLAAGPPGLLAVVVVGVLCGMSARRSLLLAPFLVGAGAAGAWVLLPALTNTDPAVSYPAATGLIPFVVYVVVAVSGVGLAAASLFSRRRQRR